MKENRFFAGKMDIKRISEDTGVDIGIATQMYIADHAMTDYSDELVAWNEAIIQHQRDDSKTLVDLFAE